MINENCLAGFSCPKCGFNDKFIIGAHAQFEVTDDGTEIAKGADVSWEDDDMCICAECDYVGSVKDFCETKKAVALDESVLAVLKLAALCLGHYAAMPHARPDAHKIAATINALIEKAEGTE